MEINALSVPEAAVVSLIILGIGTGALVTTNDIVKKELTSFQAVRIKNTALALVSYPEGSKELEISGYRIKLEGGAVKVKYKDKKASASMEEMSYDKFLGPKNFKKIERGICLEKRIKSQSTVLEISTGACN